jgi:hypothetical protein
MSLPQTPSFQQIHLYLYKILSKGIRPSHFILDSYLVMSFIKLLEAPQDQYSIKVSGSSTITIRRFGIFTIHSSNMLISSFY